MRSHEVASGLSQVGSIHHPWDREDSLALARWEDDGGSVRPELTESLGLPADSSEFARETTEVPLDAAVLC